MGGRNQPDWGSRAGVLGESRQVFLGWPWFPHLECWQAQ